MNCTSQALLRSPSTTGLAILSACVVFFLKPLDTDGMALEDQKVRIFRHHQSCSFSKFRTFNKFREYLEANGYDTAAMGLRDGEGYSEEGSVDEKESATA